MQVYICNMNRIIQVIKSFNKGYGLSIVESNLCLGNHDYELSVV